MTHKPWTQPDTSRLFLVIIECCALAAISNMAGQEDPVQREIHQDWANREYIEVITSSIKKIADFLNSFGEYSTERLTEKIDNASRRAVVLDRAS